MTRQEFAAITKAITKAMGVLDAVSQDKFALALMENLQNLAINKLDQTWTQLSKTK